jgi:hypothetical protein
MKACSVLIPNRWTYDAIEMTVESVLKRTVYPNFHIIVCDNSGGVGEASRLEYLKEQERRGNLQLIENVIERRPDGKMPYGHGENLKVLLKACQTPLAMMISSGCEVKRTDWLSSLAAELRTDKDLGVAKTRWAENHFQNCFSASRYIPNWMMLNMDIYRRFGNPDEDWELRRVPYTDYWRKEDFAELEWPAHPDPDPLQVFLDTGWRLWKRVQYENPEGFRVVDMSPRYPWQFLNFYGGLDRNSSRPEHPYVVKTRCQIEQALKELRK